MIETINKTFDICPCCGSKHRFVGKITQKVKERGLARSNWICALHIFDGIVYDPQNTLAGLIGSKRPGVHVEIDVCLDCGGLYATKIVEVESQLVPKAKPFPKVFSH